jgi:hypothetical protein
MICIAAIQILAGREKNPLFVNPLDGGSSNGRFHDDSAKRLETPQQSGCRDLYRLTRFLWVSGGSQGRFVSPYGGGAHG